MASGLPDYYRGIDLAYQALSELINRPKYGAAQISTGIVGVAAGGTETLFSISGKGVIYGGTVRIASNATQQYSTPRITLDATGLAATTLQNLKKYVVNVEHSMPIYLLAYDNTNWLYSVAYSHGITFETSVLGQYTNAGSLTATLTYFFIYAVI